MNVAVPSDVKEAIMAFAYIIPTRKYPVASFRRHFRSTPKGEMYLQSTRVFLIEWGLDINMELKNIIVIVYVRNDYK